MEAGDVEPADAVLQAAFGRMESSARDLKRYLAVQPDGWLLAEMGGSVVGMVGAVDYGDYAYIGYMAVLPEFQGQGIGRALLRKLLGWLDERGCRMTVLDATDRGAPLYVNEGFDVEGGTIVYVQTQPGQKHFPSRMVRPVTVADIPQLVAFDRPVFGADRERVFRVLLADFPERVFKTQSDDGHLTGFVFAHPIRIGPFVACNQQAARDLFQAALSLEYEGNIRMIAPNENLHAADLYGEFGFEPRLPHRHMRRGGFSIPGRRDLVYAQTGFTIG